jgi:hypothetical protein
MPSVFGKNGKEHAHAETLPKHVTRMYKSAVAQPALPQWQIKRRIGGRGFINRMSRKAWVQTTSSNVRQRSNNLAEDAGARTFSTE